MSVPHRLRSAGAATARPRRRVDNRRPPDPRRSLPWTGEERERAGSLVVLFALTLFLSASLLFLIQPMFAKMALPLLGGAPAVWNTCVVFFQTMLLAAYGYAHASTRWLGVRRHAAVHVGLLCVPLLFLPIGIRGEWLPPADQNPVPWLLMLLLVSVGVPFFMVASSAPILQKWFSASRHVRAGDPYFLYAASNAGSLLALLAYPLLLEPGLRVAQQSWVWSVGYMGLVILTLGCAVRLWRAGRRDGAQLGEAVLEQPASHRQPASEVRDTGPVTPRRRLRWVALAMVPSSLMLAVTAHISTDIAAVPLLWVVPLALYLLTFAIAFARVGRSIHGLTVEAAPVFLLILVLALVAQLSHPLWLAFPIHIGTFFVAALMCHGELARDRPAVRHLTEFYLWIAVGGWLGGVFTSLVAPLVFTGIAEYPLALMLACMLLPAVRSRPGSRAGDVGLPAAVGIATVLLLVTVKPSYSGFLIPALILPALVSLSCAWRPVRFGLAAGAMMLGGYLHGRVDRIVHAERTFFGVYRVADTSGDLREFWHGTTMHGEQSLDAGRRGEPLAYYRREGPIGQLIAALPQAGRPGRIAVVGLGTGSLAAYAQPAQAWDFYEIDPAVERIARTHFTYLDDCGNRCQVVLGDGRLALAAAAHRYDLIVLDAFSSVAIPVHLLTREAVGLYLARLTPRGVLAFHISNRHLDLEPVLARQAEHLGPAALFQSDGTSDWLVMGAAEILAPVSRDARWREARAHARVAAWTDDFSNIVAVLRPAWPIEGRGLSLAPAPGGSTPP